MALLKSSEEETPRRYKFGGQNIQQSGQGLALRKSNKTRITRTPFQKSSAGILLFMSRAWKTLDSSHVAAWSAFVTAYPQSLRRKITGFLSGYQNFIKRNYFVWLKNGVDFPLMFVPEMVEYDSDSAICEVINDTGTLKLNITFERSSGDLDTFIFVSYPTSPGKKFVATQSNFMRCVASVDQEIDITYDYIDKFGILPQIGQSVCVSIVQTGKDNGQFWFPDRSVLVVSSGITPILKTLVFASDWNGGIDFYDVSSHQYWNLYQGFVFEGGRIVNINLTVGYTSGSNFQLFLKIYTNVSNRKGVLVGAASGNPYSVPQVPTLDNFEFDLVLPAGNYFLELTTYSPTPDSSIGYSGMLTNSIASDPEKGVYRSIGGSDYENWDIAFTGYLEYYS